MSETENKLSKKEISEFVSKLYDNDLEDFDTDSFSLIDPKDFYKEVLKQKKTHGWQAKIKVPCNWVVDASAAILNKLEECRLKLNGEQFEEIWNIIVASNDISVWGSDTWAPRVLPNGTLLVRNHHRVIGIDENATGSIYKENTILQTQLTQLQNWMEENFEAEDKSIHFHFVNRNDEGFTWTVTTPEKLSDVGQTIVFVSKELMDQAKESGEFGEEHFINEESTEEAASNSRSGHFVLRVFKHVTFIYSTYRASDEYDTILENYSYFLGSEPDEDTYFERINSETSSCRNIVSQILRDQDEPELFESNAIKHNPMMKILFEDKFYNGFASIKANQMSNFAPHFAQSSNLPSTYWGNDIPFWDVSEKYDGRMIVSRGYFNFLGNISEAKSYIEDKFSSMISIVDNATVKVYLPIPKNAQYDKEEDIFEYDSKEYKNRLKEVIKSFKTQYQEYLKDNPKGEDVSDEEHEKEWVDSYGYDYEYALVFITEEFPIISEAHRYGLKISAEVDDSITIMVPAIGYYQGYANGELDTGNANIFLTSSELEETNDSDDDEYEEDDE